MCAAGSPSPKRRWLQFSLRTFLILLTLAAIWLGVTFKRVRDQRAAVARIHALGGKTVYDYERDATGKYVPNATPPGPHWLRLLVGPEFFQDVTLVYLDDSSVTDADLLLIGKLRSVTSMSLSNTLVSDAGLYEIRDCVRLRVLGLNKSKVTSEGLRHLERLSQLESLGLSETNVDDEGVLHLIALPRLQDVNLGDTRVTSLGVRQLAGNGSFYALGLQGTYVDDSAVDALVSLDQLSFLNVTRTGVSARGILTLRNAMPEEHMFDAEMVDLSGKNQAQNKSIWDAVVDRLVALDEEKRLKFLDLSNSKIDDDDILALHKLKQVQLIDLRETAVTERGAQELRRALTECEVLR